MFPFVRYAIGICQMAFVNRIDIFPMKSCDGISLPDAAVLPSGSLRHDRQFALVDAAGRLINAKRTPAIHRLRFFIDPETREYRVARREGGEEICGQLDEHGRQLSDWLSDFFTLDVSIVENEETGLPDDVNSPGPTVISTATLETVTAWFPGLRIDDVRRRFRANIEVDGVEPFWEDRLFRADKQPQPFQIGSMLFGGINPCQRCVVPTRDPHNGDIVPPAFALQFTQRREQTLPDWSPREQFNHYYRLSTNTRLLDPRGGIIRVGDAVELIAS